MTCLQQKTDISTKFTGEFIYAAPHILPSTPVAVEITLAYPPIAVNFQVFVEHPREIEMV
jgi:hypothetical protein